MLYPDDVDWNIKNRTEELYHGGEAAVHIVRWHNCRGAPSSWPIAEGERVSLKVYHKSNGKGGFKEVVSEADAEDEGGCRCGSGWRLLRYETAMRQTGARTCTAGPAALPTNTSVAWILRALVKYLLCTPKLLASFLGLNGQAH